MSHPSEDNLKRQLMAEFLGTFTLLVFGIAVVAQVVLSGETNGGYLSINIGWGLAVTMGVYVAGAVSGAHLNPAVTLAVACFRGFSWKKVVPYIIVQVIAAMVASAVVYVTYQDALSKYETDLISSKAATAAESNDDKHLQATAGIWSTYPSQLINNPIKTGLIDQVVGTALLVMCIFALGDHRNTVPGSNLAPVVVGMVVLLIGMTFGLNCGYAINPARDFGPRLFTYLFGWGDKVFTAGSGFWWVPIVGPIVGGLLGGFVYDLCLTKQHPPETES